MTTVQNTASQNTGTGLTIAAAALGAQDARRCRIEGMTQWEIENLGNSHEVNIVARLGNGKLVPCSQKVPIAKAIGMSVAIEDAVVASGIWDYSTIDRIIVDVQNLNALSRLVGAIIECNIAFDSRGNVRLVGIGRITDMPFHSYWRIAQLAQQLGIPYRVQVGDLNLIYRHIPDDASHSSYWIRYNISKSLAMSSLDGVLINENQIRTHITNNHPQVDTQIGEIRERARRERIRADRQAKRGY
ncbi:hypothetical protein LTR70_001227 [Exophiala xenobiotica]|uniref:Uncharacterized protein n=1 Tax=Lithohypha guttulata TaxID=1690604 RepID=A0ABR0KMH8_9EURO|nr:hypothetical protein LTR24_001478 [Lithohypha guttulata]KAK5328202.1 hypothetical protein LTR70_001227 [Exophiala xenobiotica]